MNLSTLQTVINTAKAGSIGKTSGVQTHSAADATQADPGKDSYDSQLKEIAQKYDVTHMTLKQVAQMAYELDEKGLIGIGDFGMLAYIGECGGAGGGALQAIRADGTFDLLKYWKGHIVLEPGDSGLKLLNELIEGRKQGDAGTAEAKTADTAQVSLPALYKSAIDSTIRNPQQVTQLLEALAANAGPSQQ